MLGTIYQISSNPILKDEFLDIDRISEGEAVSISYVRPSNKDRHSDITYLLEKILPEGMFTLENDFTLFYHGGYNEWASSLCENLQRITNQLTPANVLNWLESPIRLLKKTILNPLNTHALFVIDFFVGSGTAEQSAELMNLVKDLKAGDKLYFGSILTFHN